MEKDQDIEDTYNSIFVESKLFKNRESVSAMDLEDVAEFVFMNFITLWLMYNEPLTKDTAKSYADRTAAFGTFKYERMMGTDLYVALNVLVKEDSSIAQMLSDKDSNSKVRSKININQPTVRAFLESMASGSISDNDAARFLLKLQRMLNITNTTYKSMARTTSEWNQLRKEEKELVVRRLIRYFNSSARRCEIKPMLDDLAHSHTIDLGTDQPDKTQSNSGVKALAVAAASMYAGYKLGQAAASLINAKRLMR